MAKQLTGAYEPNKRVMLKVKHERECDCVVAGFRWHKGSEKTAVGSLLLGLFDGAGALQHVGVVASFTTAKRKELVDFLAPYRENALDAHPWREWASADWGEMQRRPGMGSRWSQGKDLSWEPVRPELVVEVAYDHMEGSAVQAHGSVQAVAPGRSRRRTCAFEQLRGGARALSRSRRSSRRGLSPALDRDHGSPSATFARTRSGAGPSADGKSFSAVRPGRSRRPGFVGDTEAPKSANA